MSKTLAPITGLRVTPMGGSTPVPPDDAVEATRPGETGPSPASVAAEAKIQDAINLIGATTDQTIRQRAIRQVREAVSEWREEWRDFADEREMFADLILVGLDHLENWVGSADAIEQKRATTLQSVKRNIEEAMDWANQNRYVKFAGSLATVLKFLQNLQ